MARGTTSDNYYESMFKEIGYMRRILNSLGPSSFRQNPDWSEVVREQDATLNTLRRDYAVMMTNLEQRMKQNTLRVFGLKETPGEDTLSVVLKYFQDKLRVGIGESDIDCCHRTGQMRGSSSSRPIIVKFTNADARKRVWRKKDDVQDSTYIAEELCVERRNVRHRAIQAFGREKVSVVQGAIQVEMEDGKDVKFYTLSQINDFLKQNNVPEKPYYFERE